MPNPMIGKVGIPDIKSKKQVDMDALNFLLLGESDYNKSDPDNQLSITTVSPNKEKTNHIQWFNDTYDFNIGKPIDIEGLLDLLAINPQTNYLINGFYSQGSWKPLGLSKNKFKNMFEKEIGIKPKESSFTNPLENYASHWQKLKNEFINNQLGTTTVATFNIADYIKLWNDYYDIIFENLQNADVNNPNFRVLLDILMKYYYLGNNCDILRNDINKNIRLLSIISYILNTRKGLIPNYITSHHRYLVFIIGLQIDKLEYLEKKNLCDNISPPPPPPPTIKTKGPDDPKWCWAIALKYSVASRIEGLCFNLFSTVANFSGGMNNSIKLEYKNMRGGMTDDHINEMIQLYITAPIDFEQCLIEHHVLLDQEIIMEKINNFQQKIDAKFDKLKEYSGNFYKLRNLNLEKEKLTKEALLNKSKFTGIYISPYKAIQNAMISATNYEDASFTSHWGIAHYMKTSFEDIAKDLIQKCNININLNDSNIVYQLLALVELHRENPNHAINQCIPEKVLVPC